MTRKQREPQRLQVAVRNQIELVRTDLDSLVAPDHPVRVERALAQSEALKASKSGKGPAKVRVSKSDPEAPVM